MGWVEDELRKREGESLALSEAAEERIKAAEQKPITALARATATAITVVQDQLEILKQVGTTRPLDEQEAKNFSVCSRTVVAMLKIASEQRNDEMIQRELSRLSDDELKALAKRKLRAKSRRKGQQ